MIFLLKSILLQKSRALPNRATRRLENGASSVQIGRSSTGGGRNVSIAVSANVRKIRCQYDPARSHGRSSSVPCRCASHRSAASRSTNASDRWRCRCGSVPAGGVRRESLACRSIFALTSEGHASPLRYQERQRRAPGTASGGRRCRSDRRQGRCPPGARVLLEHLPSTPSLVELWTIYDNPAFPT